MDAAVPFALVAAVQLLALAAALGLGVAGGAVAYRRHSRALLVAGGVLLAAAHGLTGAQLGGGGGDRFALLRAVAYVLVGLGATGLAVAPSAAAASAASGSGAGVAPAIVVPLGAAPGPAIAAAVAAFVAALLSRRASRPGAVLLTGALALTGATELLAPASRGHTGAAVTLLVLRGVASVAILAFVVRLVETSLLAKVVAAILAAVLCLALGTALIVGSVATDALSRDGERRLADVAKGQTDILSNEKQTALSLAEVIAGCRPADRTTCSRTVVATTAGSHAVTAVICAPDNASCTLPGRAFFAGLADPVAQASLRRNAAVREVVTNGHGVATLDVLLGGTPVLVELGVSPIFSPNDTAVPRKPYGAAVYAVPVDSVRVEAIGTATGFGATLYVTGRRVGSSLADTRAALIDGELRSHDVVAYLRTHVDRADDGVSVGAEGSRPGIRFQAVRSENDALLGVLALSGDSTVILATQRRVLSSLFLGTVAIALLVGVIAVALGRRIVRPVTALTVAASRIRRGDLDVRTDVRAADELGVLARTFDAMTTSLAASNESLRRAAGDEATLRGRLETVLHSIGDGLVTTDADDRVVGVNRAITDLLAADEEDLLGLPVADVLSGTTSSGEPLLRHLGESRVARVGTVERADGGLVPVSLAATPLHGEAGHVVVVRDMTREAEIERMKTEFLSNVSHELRTPLTPIRGYAEILHRRPDLPPDKTALYAGNILDSSVRMSRVVDLLVDVAAMEAGRVEPAYAQVRVATFLDERLDAWRRREPARDFRRRVAARLPGMLVDPAWVAKAFDELVDNAVKYSTAPVTLSATMAGDRVRLTVRDAGPGIPEDRRATLFTSFEQVDGSSTRAVGGLGLGLSFVRRVADDFGLDVVVESTPGKGSSFSLDVPAVAPPPAPRRRTPKGRAR
jgi:two-component system phosphate regulon sensor histidine kinase PhoR